MTRLELFNTATEMGLNPSKKANKAALEELIATATAPATPAPETVPSARQSKKTSESSITDAIHALAMQGADTRTDANGRMYLTINGKDHMLIVPKTAGTVRLAYSIDIDGITPNAVVTYGRKNRLDIAVTDTKFETVCRAVYANAVNKTKKPATEQTEETVA